MGTLFQLVLDFLSGTDRKGDVTPERKRSRRIITIVLLGWAAVVLALYLLGIF